MAFFVSSWTPTETLALPRDLEPMSEGFLAYFTKRFPRLFLYVPGVVRETGLNKEAMFRGYSIFLGIHDYSRSYCYLAYCFLELLLT